MSRKDNVEYIQEDIEYRNALIALFAIVGIFVITQGITSQYPLGILLNVASGEIAASKIIDNIVYVLIYLVAVLASITGIILLFIYSAKSIKRSTKKMMGRIGLLIAVLGIVGLAIPFLPVLTQL